MFLLSDYTYILPEELIAQEAAHPHHNARMMVIDRDSGEIIQESTFWNIDHVLHSDAVIFFNDSRVVRSRVILDTVSYTKSNGEQGTITDGEIFYLEKLSATTMDCLVRPGNKFRVGNTFELGEYTITVQSLSENGRIIEVLGWDIFDFLEEYGSLPLPPYIEYSEEKETDYQTTFAKKNGSVAAPTASLHFTEELIKKIPCPIEYLTLHVGLGTFQWIKTADVRDYAIHSEKVEIETVIFEKIARYKQGDKRIVAVGTTATRTLESLPYLWEKLDQKNKQNLDANTCNYWDSLMSDRGNPHWIAQIDTSIGQDIISFETSIYIVPGYTFRIVDDLITNFHLWESSLLVLVSAFLGYEKTMKIYDYAIRNNYRFYSFGDGMYIGGK